MINSFDKGINTDNSPETQPQGTGRYFLNAVDLTQEGDLLKISTERGTITFCNTLPSGYKLIGHDTLNQDIIVFLTNEVGSKIGIIDVNGIYTEKKSDSILGFSIDFPIKCESRIGFNGHRIIYFTDKKNPFRRIDLDSGTLTVEDSEVFSNTTLPVVKLSQINENVSGKLFTGVYQFAVRHLFDDLSPSTFGFVSNPIPIVDDLRTVGRNQFDGAPINTEVLNKSITIEINNIDVSKKFIEVAVITYKGLANEMSISTFARRSITGETMNVTYTGLEEITEVTLEELIEESISFDTVGALTQKDNRLFIADLTSGDQQALQVLANNINVSYNIEVEVYSEDSNSFNDYKDEKKVSEQKTYMSEEVYALSMGVIFNNGTISFGFHIPAKIPSTSWVSADDYTINFPANYTPISSQQKWYNPSIVGTSDLLLNQNNKPLGTYISNETYEPGKDYVTDGPKDNGGNSYVRHHLIPPLDLEPHFTDSSGVTYLRYKSLSFSAPDFSLIPSSLANKITGYFFARADRNVDNRSILAQGLVQRMITYSSYGSNSPVQGTFFKESPLFGNFTMTTDGGAEGWRGDNANYAPIDFSQANHNIQNDHYTNPNKGGVDNKLYTFYSPDFILGNVPLSPNNIKEKMIIEGNMTAPGGTSMIMFETPGEDVDLNGDENRFRFYLYNDYNKRVSSRNTKINVNSHYYYNNSNAVFRNIYSLNNKTILEDFTTPHYTLELSTLGYYPSVSDPYLGSGNFYAGFEINSSAEWAGGWISDGAHKRVLVNLQKNIPSQYSNLSNLEYTPILIIPNRNAIGINLNCYNGDTFISKFAYKNSTLLKIVPVNDGNGNVKVNNFPSPGVNDPESEGVPVQALSYFFVESVVNCNYRHRVPGGVPYFPKTSMSAVDTPDTAGDFVFDSNPKFGHSTGYNLLYSKNNSPKVSRERPFGFESVSNSTNTIYYSEESIEGEQFDAYRKFLPNNFHSIPKNTGKIVELFVYNNTLFAHTPKSLWRCSVNEQVTTPPGYDGESTRLGNGGLFPVPSREILTTEGGYGGSISRFAGKNTLAGRMFPDVLQGKIFLLNNQLIDVTRNINSREVAEMFASMELQDNPFKPGAKGLHAVYDPTINRYLLTKQSGINSTTLSYSFNANCFRSYHSFTPHTYITLDNKLFAVDNSETSIKIYEHHRGDYLKFYSKSSPDSFIIEFVVINQQNTYIPDNLTIYSSTKDINNNLVPLKNFNYIKVYNDNQNTDFVNSSSIDNIGIVCTNSFNQTHTNRLQSIMRFVNNEYRLFIPKNNVINNTLPIDSLSNLNPTTNIPLYRDRIKGKYAIIKLIYKPDAIDNYKLSVIGMSTAIRNKTR